MKKVIVTGANGFVGRHTLALLNEQGYEVHAVDIRLPDKAEPNVFWHQSDLLDHSATASLVNEISPTHLLHFAWYAEPGKYWTSSLNFHWLEASLHLLRSFHQAGGHRVVMSGTCAEYDWSYGFCSELLTPRRPSTPYGVCKNALFELLMSYSSQESLSCAWGRIFFMYGPNEHPARLVSSVINSLLDGKAIRCTHGQQIRDFLHVEDVALAFVTLLSSEHSGPINIASGDPVKLEEIIFEIADFIGRRDLIELGAISTPENDPLVLFANSSILRSLGWSPHFNLTTGISQTTNWWRSSNFEGQ